MKHKYYKNILVAISKKATRLVLIASIWIASLNSLHAQELFNHSYIFENGTVIATSLKEYANNYYLVGNIGFQPTDCELGYRIGTHVTKVNKNGIRDTSFIFYDCNKKIGSFSFDTNIFNIINDKLMILTKIHHMDKTTNLSLIEMSPDFDNISTLDIMHDTASKIGAGFIVDRNNNYIIYGCIDSSFNEENTYAPDYLKALMIKMRPDGTQVWAKTYSFKNEGEKCWAAFKHVIETIDGDYLVLGETSDFDPNRRVGSMAVKIDSMGNQKWVKYFGDVSPSFIDVIETQDSCYIFSGAYEYEENKLAGNLLKVNKDGVGIWDRRHRDTIIHSNNGTEGTFFTVYHNMALKDNGDIILATRSKVTDDGQYMADRLRIICVDEFGHRKWNKLIFDLDGLTGFFFPFAIILTSDGGIAVTGFADLLWTENGQTFNEVHAFLVKTDSLGNHIYTHVQPGEKKTISDFKLKPYPNPSQNEFYIDLPEEIDNDILEVWSINGKLILSKTLSSGVNKIEMENLPKETYLLRLRNAKLYGKVVLQ
ncbi:MAG: T9SS type A sorting domain-containing protein [Bacteroidales bacterium]|nr:T9SS type A sorting domain-containing protein [Bacteroidales bacterium]